jgi:hypothetical protein
MDMKKRGLNRLVHYANALESLIIFFIAFFDLLSFL